MGLFHGDEFDSAYFYTGRRAVLLGDPSELAALLARPETVYCIADRRQLDAMGVPPVVRTRNTSCAPLTSSALEVK